MIAVTSQGEWNRKGGTHDEIPMCPPWGRGESRVTDSPKEPWMPKVYSVLSPIDVGAESVGK